jgi:dolichol-phosphate mannosyltransferase
MNWVVIPTYNEKENLEKLLMGVFVLPDIHVLVVDDNSPDGTGQLADALQARWPHLKVLHRPHKSGLSDAYREGLQAAVDAGATIVMHMDADGSHQPIALTQLLSALGDADVAIGSRYIRGGQLAIPWYRRWISSIGNLYLRLVLGPVCHDWSSGFKAWRVEALRGVLNQPWPTTGYACLVVMSWLSKESGARIREVPINFTDRQQGDSKFSLSIMLEDLWVPWKLRQSRLAQHHNEKSRPTSDSP